MKKILFLFLILSACNSEPVVTRAVRGTIEGVHYYSEFKLHKNTADCWVKITNDKFENYHLEFLDADTLIIGVIPVIKKDTVYVGKGVVKGQPSWVELRWSKN